jgi:hypothetical protein
MWIAQNPGVFLQSQREQLRGLYGAPADVGELDHGGPYSLQQYLHYMLGNNVWGDQCIITAISMMFGVAISVVNTRGMTHLPFRHDRTLGEADVVLLYNGVTHYSAAGNYLYQVDKINRAVDKSGIRDR